MKKLVTPPLLLALAVAVDAGTVTAALADTGRDTTSANILQASPTGEAEEASKGRGDSDSGSFWQGGDDGWFFYNEEKPEEKKPKPKPKPKKPPETKAEVTEAPEQAPPPPASSKSEGEPPDAFSAEWFRVNIPKYRDKAWNEPTVENVQAFMYLQRYMMDRSEEFADAAELAVLGHPWLDESTRRPTGSRASKALDRSAGARKNKTLELIADRAGIFFFYHSRCQACSDMANVVDLLSDQFTVIPISADGEDLPTNPFPDFRENDGHIEQIGVQQFPSLYLASANGEFAPFAFGPVSLSDARHRMVVAARRMGWISEEEFNQTRPVRNLDQNLADKMRMGDITGDDKSNFVEPSEILRRIDKAAAGPARPSNNIPGRMGGNMRGSMGDPDLIPGGIPAGASDEELMPGDTPVGTSVDDFMPGGMPGKNAN